PPSHWPSPNPANDTPIEWPQHSCSECWGLSSQGFYLFHYGPYSKFVHCANGGGPMPLTFFGKQRIAGFLPHRCTPVLTRTVLNVVGIISRVNDIGCLVSLFEIVINLLRRFVDLRARKPTEVGYSGDASMCEFAAATGTY